MEGAHRRRLALGEAGIEEKKPAPALKDFAQRFIGAIPVRCAERPSTVQFYANKLARLLEFEPVAQARLDKIGEALMESYVQGRSKQVSPASTNRELATLRRALRLAQEWRVIDRVPRIRLNLKGERERDFVLSHAQEIAYLAAAPQPLADAAMLLLDTGLRISELRDLEWRDVHFEPVGEARLGYLHVRGKPGPDGVYRGKSKNAKRSVSLSERVGTMLKEREAGAKSPWVFTDEEGTGPLSIFTLEDQHGRVRKALKLHECVIHSFRHTFGTRLGESGADAFTIMRAMGHSSVTVSQKYVHPTPEAMERAFERLEAMNRMAITGLPETPKRLGPATIPATVPKAGEDVA